jgi:hypothetical protein
MTISYPLKASSVDRSVFEKLPHSNTGFYRVKRDFIAFKKVCHRVRCLSVALLLIPKGAHVYLTTYKCRASMAYVCGIRRCAGAYDALGHLKVSHYKTAESQFDSRFKYRVGECVVPDLTFSYEMEECESGIHFFCDERDAELY